MFKQKENRVKERKGCLECKERETGRLKWENFDSSFSKLRARERDGLIIIRESHSLMLKRKKLEKLLSKLTVE